jgi:hypothetical protein
MEAFALLILENNHKAWLYEEKKTHQNNFFLMEHDCPPSCKKPSLVNKILDGVHFKLEKDTSPTVLCNKNNAVYKNLGKKRRDWLEKFYKSDHCLKTNVAVLKKASSGSGDEDNNSEVTGDQEAGFIAKERAKKTMKLTRELREFTGVPSAEAG